MPQNTIKQKRNKVEKDPKLLGPLFSLGSFSIYTDAVHQRCKRSLTHTVDSSTRYFFSIQRCRENDTHLVEEKKKRGVGMIKIIIQRERKKERESGNIIRGSIRHSSRSIDSAWYNNAQSLAESEGRKEDQLLPQISSQ